MNKKRKKSESYARLKRLLADKKITGEKSSCVSVLVCITYNDYRRVLILKANACLTYIIYCYLSETISRLSNYSQ